MSRQGSEARPLGRQFDIYWRWTADVAGRRLGRRFDIYWSWTADVAGRRPTDDTGATRREPHRDVPQQTLHLEQNHSHEGE